MFRRVYDKDKRMVIAVNIFALEYAVLLVVFLIVAYNVLKDRDGDDRTGENKD
jgi:hypothetical protein